MESIVLMDSATDKIIAETPVRKRSTQLSALERAMIVSAEENERRADQVDQEDEEDDGQILPVKRRKQPVPETTIKRRAAKKARTRHQEKHCRCGGRGCGRH